MLIECTQYGKKNFTYYQHFPDVEYGQQEFYKMRIK